MSDLAFGLIALIWSAYQGARGVMEQQLNRGQPWFDGLSPAKRFWLLYLHDFAFRFVCAFAGFVALHVCWELVRIRDLAHISAGGGAVTIAAFLFGVAGVGGQLHYLLLMGKVPRCQARSRRSSGAHIVSTSLPR